MPPPKDSLGGWAKKFLGGGHLPPPAQDTQTTSLIASSFLLPYFFLVLCMRARITEPSGSQLRKRIGSSVGWVLIIIIFLHNIIIRIIFSYKYYSKQISDFSLNYWRFWNCAMRIWNFEVFQKIKYPRNLIFLHSLKFLKEDYKKKPI